MNDDLPRRSPGESSPPKADPRGADLRAIVFRDLRPVRPLWPPSRRALALTPLAIAIVVGVPLVNFFRTDLAALGSSKPGGYR
jgi:hypothetical protein